MDTFYAALPPFEAFERIVDHGAYRSLPDDWVIGLTDVVSSTAAIAQGRAKAVNLAGAAVVSALANARGSLDFPYVFMGDGMACAFPGSERALLEDTLATCVGWVGAALELTLRAAVVPIGAIRSAGHDVRLARFRPGKDAAFAMFAGGGLAWADTALKSGRLPTLPTRSGRPDLAGLSCRFAPVPSRQGVILSLIATPTSSPPSDAFRRLVDDLLRITAGGHPVPPGGPDWSWLPSGLDFEQRLQHRPGVSTPLQRALILLKALIVGLAVRCNVPLGPFSPTRYRSELVSHSDFRKFGDGLMMTVDCTAEQADAIETLLGSAARDGIAEFGAHRQAAAMMTCVVPAPSRGGHVHFIDGADGGYTLAARQLKENRTRRHGDPVIEGEDRAGLSGVAL